MMSSRKLAIFFRRTSLERVGKTTLDGAKSNDDVVARADRFGCFARILISQRVDADVGMFRLNRLSNGVDELQQRTCRAAFRVINRLALLTLAIIEGVVLRDADDRGLRVFLDPLPHALDGHLQHVRVGKTTLDIAAFAFAIDEREILRVIFVKVRWHQIVEGVDERMVDGEGTAVFLRQAVMLAVEVMSGGKISIVHRFAPVNVSVLERGHARLVQCGQFDAILARDDFQLRREPAHAKFFFEQRINAIQCAARSASSDD